MDSIDSVFNGICTYRDWLEVIFPCFAMNILFFIGSVIALTYGFKLFYSPPSGTGSDK